MIMFKRAIAAHKSACDRISAAKAALDAADADMVQERLNGGTLPETRRRRTYALRAFNISMHEKIDAWNRILGMLTPEERELFRLGEFRGQRGEHHVSREAARIRHASRDRFHAAGAW
ncbi:MAG: hypothetical protein P8Y47_04900 [Alphaproteobacteria bacterium]